MRKTYEKQLPLMHGSEESTQAKELEQISKILNQNLEICDLIISDINHGKSKKSNGANGMTAEQIFRSAIIKQMFGYSYDDLAFHIKDSISIMKFCLIGIADKGFKKSALCKNIKAISPETWEAINKILTGFSKDNGIEAGREVRIDATVVESNIHEPKDSIQLWDVVRVLTRILTLAKELFPSISILFQDNTKRAKRRMIGIENSKTEKERNIKYKDLLKVTQRVIKNTEHAVESLEQSKTSDIRSLAIIMDLKHFIELGKKVVDQTARRVVAGESVPASEKVLSIFENHTDIIIKDRRENYFGHKVFLTGGKSNLILDCKVVEGNPSDTELAVEMIDRQKDIYGKYPLKASFDGGFASLNNLKEIKDRGVKDVCFAKKRGLEVEDMCRSEYVYKRLRNFRAGIEAGISWLKRCFGFWRCTWKGFRSFKSYVWSSIVAANLLTIARRQLA